jgi:hypothetical protein
MLDESKCGGDRSVGSPRGGMCGLVRFELVQEDSDVERVLARRADEVGETATL